VKISDPTAAFKPTDMHPAVTKQVRMMADDAFEAGHGNVLVLDHFNINHEKGRHDLLKAFYFDLLGLAIDPRKVENLEKGKKTLWANAGAHQFHLPEAESAQVFDGTITMTFEDDEFKALLSRLESPPGVLEESKFAWKQTEAGVLVTDPWGSVFNLVHRDGPLEPRGAQPGPASQSTGLQDLTVHVSSSVGSVAGIRRFYTQILGCAVNLETDHKLVLQVGPEQTLTFLIQPEKDGIAHEDMVTLEEGIANNGPHISMYVRDLKETFKRAHDLDVVFVNHRFSRRAYTLEDALDQCMFRILDVVDPLDPGAGPIVRLEHEVRSTVKVDGSKYKSCPFFEVPTDVVRP